MARPLSVLTQFILSLPPSLSAKEVVAKAKNAGMKTSEGNIYQVRRKYGGGGRRGAKARGRTAAGKMAKRPSAKPTAADFIRTMAHARASEVAEAARAEGFRFDAKYVSTIRSMDRKNGKKAPVPQRGRRFASQGAMISAAATGKGSAAEKQFRQLIVKIGVSRAMALVEQVSSRLATLIG